MKKVGIDLYAKDVALANLINVNGGSRKGQHNIRFKLVGRNDKASAYRKAVFTWD